MHWFIKILLFSVVFGIHLSGFTNEKEVDLSSDDFSVFRHLANEYLEEQFSGKAIHTKNEFGTGLTSFDNNLFPKVGFIGYELINKNGQLSLLKIQTFKDIDGWRIVNILDNHKIHQAHPTYIHQTEHSRTRSQSEAKLAAAIELENWLIKQNIINSVRSTQVRCYSSKDNAKASCHGVFGLKIAGSVECMSKSYLMVKQKDQWHAKKEISYKQKVNYKSGEIETTKPFAKRCT
jgi:hypothetical protein